MNKSPHMYASFVRRSSKIPSGFPVKMYGDGNNSILYFFPVILTSAST